VIRQNALGRLILEDRGEGVRKTSTPLFEGAGRFAAGKGSRVPGGQRGNVETGGGEEGFFRQRRFLFVNGEKKESKKLKKQRVGAGGK